MAHALRLTSRPYGDIHLFLRVLWFKLSQSFCSGRPLGADRVCKYATHRKTPSDHPRPTALMTKGQAALPCLTPPLFPALFFLSLPCHIHFPVFLCSRLIPLQ